MIKREIRIFFTALMFFTRIPCPAWVDHDPEYLQKASRYFPLMGFIVGGWAALLFWGMAFIFPKAIAILISMAGSVWLTGAFHEDGFADVCDGFGGGWTAQRILDIMKDSRLGTFGVIGLSLLLALKFTALFYLETALIPFLMVAGHVVSRMNSTVMIATLPYARTDDQSKSKPLSTRLDLGSLLFVLLSGISVLFWPSPYLLLSLIPLALAHWYLARFFMKWIEGYTGDCLGAVQQVSEVVFYLSLFALPALGIYL